MTLSLVLYIWFFIASVISGLVLPGFGRMAVKRQEVEGNFRAMHARLIENSEMIAFMGGEVPEKKRTLLSYSFFLCLGSWESCGVVWSDLLC